MIRSVPFVLAALPALGVARLLPAEGAGLYVRLAAATAVVLLPGLLAARAVGRRDVPTALVLALALVFAALTLTFALSASLVLVVVLLGLAAAGALPFALRREREPLDRAEALVLGAGVLFGIALWHVARAPGGDALFHLGRVQKLLAFDDLSPASLNEFADGGLHPGYAFPLWHAFLALVAHIGGVDPADVARHEASVLAPLAFLIVFAAGAALFRSAWLGGAVLAAQLALSSLAAGHGGAFTTLAMPATASKLLVVPAVLALVFEYVRAPSRALLAAVAAGGLVLTLIHPTYSLFLALVLGGFLAVRALFDRADGRRLGTALAAFLVPTAAAVAWLLPIVRETASHRPDEPELERALRHYAGYLDVVADGSYRLAPEVVARSGAVAVAALALVPLAALAARRAWAAFVFGGSLAVLVVLLVPALFTALSDAVSLSQSRRLAGFVPFAFALAGGAAVLARVAGVVVLPLALAAGVALQLAFQGDFTLRLDDGGGPPMVTWFAAVGGAAALTAAAVARSRGLDERRDAVAAASVALFVLPVAIDAAASWTPRARSPVLTPGLVAFLDERVPERTVVFSDLETSYRIAASAPVYIAAAPPAHVADTDDNRPYERRDDVRRFFRTGDLAIPRSYGAEWLVVDRSRFEVRPKRPVAYEDERYAVYRL